MSSGLECHFVQTTPTEWFYLLQDWNAPAQCWDWREHATAYGPFGDQQAAEEHLDRNHSNPGGWSVHELAPGVQLATLDEPVAVAVAAARLRRESPRHGYAMRGG